MKKEEIKVLVNVDAEEAIKALDAVCVKIDDVIKKANQLKAISADADKENNVLSLEVKKYLSSQTSYLLTEIMRIFTSTHDESIKLDCLKLLNNMAI